MHIARAAGYDSLFIDPEHTSLTIKDANQLCITAISAGITSFLRVPRQYMFDLKTVLGLGAMGMDYGAAYTWRWCAAHPEMIIMCEKLTHHDYKRCTTRNINLKVPGAR